MEELLFQRVRSTAIIRLRLLESDLESLRIAFEDYTAAKYEVDLTIAKIARGETDVDTYNQQERAQSRIFHHAKVFIVVMRRFARLLEAAKLHKHEYPHEIAEILDLTLKRTKVFFEDYCEARNAIEHIDGEVNGYNKKFTNLHGNSLEVVDGKRAHITQSALETVEKAWARIIDVIMRPAEERVRSTFMQSFLIVLQKRIERVQQP